MAVARLHTWIAGEILLASDLNSEFNNILTNGTAVAFPATSTVSMGGFALYLDAANTIALTGATNGVSLTGGAFNTPQGADIASAATLNLDTATGNSPDVTGTTTITAVTLSQGRQRLCRFTGALTITNGASLVVEGGADFTTVAGQYVLFVGYASSVVRCIPFTTPAATQALTNKAISASTVSSTTIGNSNTVTLKDTLFSVQDDGDATKLLQFQLAGFTTASTRVLTPPDQSVTLGQFPRLYYSGLQAINNGGTPNTKIDISAGHCRDGADAVDMVMSAGTIDCATNGANGLDTGSLASTTWYHTWAIMKPDFTKAYLASTSATAPTMPSGYTLKRRIKGGQFLTDGSAHFKTQTPLGAGKQAWMVPLSDLDTTNPGTSAVTRTLTVPTGIRVTPIGTCVIRNQSSAAINFLITALVQTDTAPSATVNTLRAVYTGAGNLTYNTTYPEYGITNTSAQFRTRQDISAANDEVQLITFGWRDDVEID